MTFHQRRGFVINATLRTLTPKQVVKLREERAAGIPLRTLEKKWGITLTAISRICRGDTYMEIGGPRTFGRANA